MIKFTGERNGRLLLGFGLSRGNVDRLTNGQPILVDLKEMGVLDGELVIFFGETEAALTDELDGYGLIGPETKVNIDPKLKS